MSTTDYSPHVKQRHSLGWSMTNRGHRKSVQRLARVLGPYKNQDSQRATGEDPLSLYGLRSAHTNSAWDIPRSPEPLLPHPCFNKLSACSSTSIQQLKQHIWQLKQHRARKKRNKLAKGDRNTLKSVLQKIRYSSLQNHQIWIFGSFTVWIMLLRLFNHLWWDA